ncbi:MAG: hypothetical protein ABSH29_15870, partial [Acidimicrobiales bacterium]
HNDTNHNDTNHNDTNHNDTNHNDTNHNDTNHNDTNHNDTNSAHRHGHGGLRPWLGNGLYSARYSRVLRRHRSKW